jgi:hypothetical protein
VHYCPLRTCPRAPRTGSSGTHVANRAKGRQVGPQTVGSLARAIATGKQSFKILFSSMTLLVTSLHFYVHSYSTPQRHATESFQHYRMHWSRSNDRRLAAIRWSDKHHAVLSSTFIRGKHRRSGPSGRISHWTVPTTLSWQSVSVEASRC